MPKQVYHIKAFEGGINKKADPRDIEDNQLVEATNVNVSNVGRVTMPGNGKSSFVTVNAENVPVSPTDSEGQDRFDNETPISSGHGLFSFTHDYDFNNTSVSDNTGPNEIDTEFICVNDGADIDIWTDNFEGTDYGPWKDSLISMGTVHNTGTDGNSENLLDVKGVKPVYYKADNGLRVCDANFSEEVVEDAMVNGKDLTRKATNFTVDPGNFGNNDIGSYIKINEEVVKITGYTSLGDSPNDLLNIERGRFGTSATSHSADIGGNGKTNVIKINVPKIFTHIKRPMLKKAGANTNINRWVQDIQVPEAPVYDALKIFDFRTAGENNGDTLNSTSTYPSEPEKVSLGLEINTVDTDVVYTIKSDSSITAETSSTETIIKIVLASQDSKTTALADIHGAGFAIGKFVSISNCTGDDSSYLNGVFEIVGIGSGAGELKIISDADAIGYDPTGSEQIVLEDETIADNIKNKYIFGMSYLYDGGGSEMQESNITTALHNSTDGSNLLSDKASRMYAGVSIPDGQWKVMDASLANEAACTTLNPLNYDYPTGSEEDGILSTADGTYLYFQSTTRTVNTASYFYVSGNLTFTNCSGVSLQIYAGLGPGTATTGSEPLTVSQPTSGNGQTSFSGIVKSGAAVDSDVLITIKTIGADDGGSPTESVRFRRLQITKQNFSIMSENNAFDFRQITNIAKSHISFLCNNSRTGIFNNTTQNNSWNERIEGFRIYIKQVDIIGGGLAEEWLMLYDVDLKEGTYTMHAKDTDIEDLRLGDVSGSEWDFDDSNDLKSLVTNNINGDSIKILPLITYEANNGYEAGTNLAARYKATATVDRKVYIGNLKIGDKTFPDRMLRSDTDRFDTFPDDGTHFIDVATSDGESIVALESVGDKLIQYKEKTAYLIKVTSEGEELVSTWSGAGIKNSCQVAKSNEGIFWVNSNGIYYYDGEKLSNVSSDKFRIDNWLTNEDFKRPVIVGYDKYSNKLIILTTNISGASSSGYIYDIANSSITQHNNLFNWYQLSNPSDVIMGNTESEL